MEECIESFKRKTGFISFGGVSDQRIKETEIELSVVFSEEYYKYVSTFGCASFYEHELTGICDSPRLNVVDVTIREREMCPCISSNWYVIEETNIDGIVIWQDPDGKIYRSTPRSKPIFIFDSLCEYIQSC